MPFRVDRYVPQENLKRLTFTGFFCAKPDFNRADNPVLQYKMMNQCLIIVSIIFSIISAATIEFEILESGTCPEERKISHSECKTGDATHNKYELDLESTSYPTGCVVYQKGDSIAFNSETSGTVSCSAQKACLCKKQQGK